MLCSYYFSYSIRSNMAIRPQGPQFPREPPRSTIRVAAFQIAIEYEYRPLSRTEYRFADHEYDEIRCEALTLSSSYFHLVCQQFGLCLDCILIL